MSKLDKQAQRQALRNFLTAIPAALERASKALWWAVVLGAAALIVVVLHGLGRGHRPPLPGGAGDSATAALFVRDLGRMPDGRHTFDLVYHLVLRNGGAAPFAVDNSFDRLALGDTVAGGDVMTMAAAPEPGADTAGGPGGGIAWRVVASRKAGLAGAYRPGQARSHAAHYRLIARADQFADVLIAYSPAPPPHWWGAIPPVDYQRGGGNVTHEEVQLGAVLRAHCPLGVNIVNGAMVAQCAAAKE